MIETGDVDVLAIRQRHFLKWYPISQLQFAGLYGFTLGAVKDWEQGRRKPGRTARILLALIARDPAAVQEMLGAEMKGLRLKPARAAEPQ